MDYKERAEGVYVDVFECSAHEDEKNLVGMYPLPDVLEAIEDFDVQDSYPDPELSRLVDDILSNGNGRLSGGTGTYFEYHLVHNSNAPLWAE